MPERFFEPGVREVDVALVNHTGTIIRFRPSLRTVIPDGPRLVELHLPDGAVLPGRLYPHPANPYIAGPELRGWIRATVPERRTRPARLREIRPGVLEVKVFSPGLSGVPDTAVPRVLRPRVRALRAETNRTRLKRRFLAWERSPAVRAWALELWPPLCQVRGCRVGHSLPESLRPAVVQIHHLTHVSQGGSDDPLNLCLLCATHHTLVHNAPTSEVVEWTDGSVEILVNGLTLKVDRDLNTLTP